MIDWYTRIAMNADADVFALVFDAITYYTAELEEARKETKIRGEILLKMVAQLPGIMEYRYAQYQQLTHIRKFLEILLEKTHSEMYQKYFEKNNKALKSTDAKEYVLKDPEYVNMKILVNHIEHIENQFLCLHEALKSKNYNLGYITKIKSSAFEDYVVPEYE